MGEIKTISNCLSSVVVAVVRDGGVFRFRVCCFLFSFKFISNEFQANRRFYPIFLLLLLLL